MVAYFFCTKLLKCNAIVPEFHFTNMFVVLDLCTKMFNLMNKERDSISSISKLVNVLHKHFNKITLSLATKHSNLRWCDLSNECQNFGAL